MPDKIPHTDTNKVDLEKKIKEIMDKNKWWKQAWSMIFGTVIIGFLMALVLAVPVKWLWNETMPYIFNDNIGFISEYWSAVKILFLIRLVFPVRWK